MELFIDTAHVEEIKEAASWGVISGVTTNPTLIAKEKRDFKEVVKEICCIVSGPISAEVISTNCDGMVKEARELVQLAPNVVIKIPMTMEGIKAVHILKQENIRTNVTLIFSANQALLAARAGATYVSPFVGRLDDIGYDGTQVVKDTKDIFNGYGLATQVIAASIRHPQHVLQAAQAGSDIATVPYGILCKMFKHPLTDKGIERFLKDWEGVEGSR